MVLACAIIPSLSTDLPLAPAALAGANAAVVGVLALALWNPVWTGSVHSLSDALLAGAGFVALAILFFAFTTIVAYYYMAETNLAYLNRQVRRPWMVLLLRLALIAAVAYGTLRSEVAPHLAAGRDVVMDLDPQGAATIRQLLPKTNS